MSGSRKRKPTRDAVQKVSKQESIESNNGNLDQIMSALMEQNSTPMTNQQFVDNLTLATVLGGSQGNNDVFNAFFQTGMLQNDPNNLLNVLNATIQGQTTATSNGTSGNNTNKKSPSSKKSPKRSASPSAVNGKSDDIKPVIKREKEEEFTVSLRCEEAGLMTMDIFRMNKFKIILLVKLIQVPPDALTALPQKPQHGDATRKENSCATHAAFTFAFIRYCKIW